MRIPDSLASLADYGIIEEVLRPLMSGKEAQIYLVISGGQQRVAKVYKEAQNRTFKNRAEYTEGRKVRNSRDQRAMGKNSRHGRAQAEAAWRTTEVEMIYRLRDAGVRVPTPYHFIDSVLVMEMITDAEGNPAPRLGDLNLEPEEAQPIFDRLLSEVVRMLAAGVVHGDLSDFNVLMGTDGPVVIDFPQAVDASSNQNARKLLVRDVDNLHRFMTRFVPEWKAKPYAQEMWQLYERSQLSPDTKLIGRHQASERKANTNAVLDLIGDAAHDERRRRESLGLRMRGTSNLPRPERGRGHEAGARDEPTKGATPALPARRVEVVMHPRGQQHHQQHHASPRDARAQGQRGTPGPVRSREPGQERPQRSHGQQPGQDRPQRALGQQAGQERPQRAHAQQPGQERPQRPLGQEPGQERPQRAHAQESAMPRPAQGAPQANHPRHAPPVPNAVGGTDDTAAGGAQKRRRRRRRRKPGAEAAKVPGREG